IKGKQLPLQRLINVLDKEQLCTLVNKLIQEKPELNEIVLKKTYSLKLIPGIENSLKYLENYLNGKILKNLPYKDDIESEYSFLRIEKNLIEFYNILSDFLLSFLPPIEISFKNSIFFINGVTNIIHNLPNFKISQYNLYHKSNIYNQLSDAWL
ncbi:Sts1p, partial [Ascoidea rubescens DSM 1968]